MIVIATNKVRISGITISELKKEPLKHSQNFDKGSFLIILLLYFQGTNRPILVSSTAPTATGVRTLDDILDNDDSSADENETAQDEYRVIDHSAPLNVDAMNTDYIK